MTRTVAELPALEPGWVWLVGAGPGDAGLITRLGAHGLAQAEVVVYDALVGDDVLALAGPEATLEYAGKRGGRASLKQPDISLRLIRLAREGRRVVRLKGGDPFVFGRGGEEAMALAAAAVPFRIVPGITAGIGGLAYAGIPVTHRDTNAAVTFVTGHGAGGDVPGGLDWDALARGSPVIVVYMALKHLGTISERLIGAGRDPATPVAIIAKATLPGQRVVETTLSRAVADAAAAAIEPPTVVAIGEVVRLRAALDWIGAMAGRVLEADPLGTGARSTGS